MLGGGAEGDRIRYTPVGLATQKAAGTMMVKQECLYVNQETGDMVFFWDWDQVWRLKAGHVSWSTVRGGEKETRPLWESLRNERDGWKKVTADEMTAQPQDAKALQLGRAIVAHTEKVATLEAKYAAKFAEVEAEYKTAIGALDEDVNEAARALGVKGVVKRQWPVK